GEKDNFWSMGDTGPCGPCTEIFYDHGPDVEGGPPGSPEEDGDRYVEIWNLVFMQFDRSADGAMTPLPKPSVDTGMGLERVAAVMQGVHSNYDIDLFQSIIKSAAAVTKTGDLDNPSLKVIADHIRACSFLIVDGVLPSNEGRGYVLRRIIRRALRHGNKLGTSEPFFWRLASTLNEAMGEAYPELTKSLSHVERVLRQEEERFAETLDQGMVILEQAIRRLSGDTIAGETVFKLYDTYGFPMDLTADIARERNLKIDEAGFAKSMAAQRDLSKASSAFKVDLDNAEYPDEVTQFTGYNNLKDEGQVTAIVVDGKMVSSLNAGQSAIVFLNKTPFYGESGGQVGDHGVLSVGDSSFQVADTKKFKKAHGHIGELSAGELKVGDAVTAQVDDVRRNATILNHSATHLMHAALRHVLGDHVQQKGSLVEPDRLRFDFSHYEPLTLEQLNDIEDVVNGEIRANAKAEIRELPYDQAIAEGALAFFGDKYDADVRVLRLGDISMELCGGTHVSRAGDIGVFKILSESGIAAGVRRIEAVTGACALRVIKHNEETLAGLASALKAPRDELSSKVTQMLEKNKQLERDLKNLKTKMATGGSQTDDAIVDVSGIKVLTQRLDDVDVSVLREAVDRHKDRLGAAVVVLASANGETGKVTLVAGVTKNETDRVQAGRVVKAVSEQVGGKGGGRPDMAQGGGSDVAGLDKALAQVPEIVQQAISN
ncbi:MAG: alanine--tRNA ligase, partial [Pseudomonadota bacterium]